MCAHACVCAHGHGYVGQSKTSGVGPHLPPCLRKSLSAHCSVLLTCWPFSLGGFFCLCHPSPGRSSERVATVPGFYMDSEDSNPGPCTYMANTLPAELSPQPIHNNNSLVFYDVGIMVHWVPSKRARKGQSPFATTLPESTLINYSDITGRFFWYKNKKRQKGTFGVSWWIRLKLILAFHVLSDSGVPRQLYSSIKLLFP